MLRIRQCGFGRSGGVVTPVLPQCGAACNEEDCQPEQEDDQGDPSAGLARYDQAEQDVDQQQQRNEHGCREQDGGMV